MLDTLTFKKHGNEYTVYVNGNEMVEFGTMDDVIQLFCFARRISDDKWDRSEMRWDVEGIDKWKATSEKYTNIVRKIMEV